MTADVRDLVYKGQASRQPMYHVQSPTSMVLAGLLLFVATNVVSEAMTPWSSRVVWQSMMIDQVPQSDPASVDSPTDGEINTLVMR